MNEQHYSMGAPKKSDGNGMPTTLKGEPHKRPDWPEYRCKHCDEPMEWKEIGIYGGLFARYIAHPGCESAAREAIGGGG